MDRRTVLIGGLAAFCPIPTLAQGFAADPFTLGVASSLPGPNAVTLWTRLAISPLDLKGGMDPVATPVAWELSEDENFRTVVAKENLSNNPHVKHYDGSERGYLLHDITASRWLTDMRVLDNVQDMDTPVRSQAKFAVEAGKPGVQRA